MTRFALSREFFTPKNATKICDKQSDAVAYIYKNQNGRPCARVFYGKQAKPVLAAYYMTEEQRNQAVTRYFESRRAVATRKAEARKARSEWQHSYKVGDLFRTCWGYEQTNVEWYECIGLKGKSTLVLRRIKTAVVHTTDMTGRCSPLPGAYCGEAIERRANQYGAKISSHITAFHEKPEQEVGGVRIYRPANWTSYA